MCVGAFFVESLEGISEDDAGLGIFKTCLFLTNAMHFRLQHCRGFDEILENNLNRKSFPTSW